MRVKEASRVPKPALTKTIHWLGMNRHFTSYRNAL